MPVIVSTPATLPEHLARYEGDRRDQTVQAGVSRGRDLAYIATQACYADTMTQDGELMALLTVPVCLITDLAAEALALLPPDTWEAVLDQAREYRADRGRGSRK